MSDFRVTRLKFGEGACCAAFLLLGGVFSAPFSSAQGFLTRFEQRTERYTAGQPRWASTIFTTSPMLSQRLREDFVRQISPTGVRTWNLGASRGLQLIPMPRTELDIALPPFLRHSDGTPDGFGDLTTAAKLRLLSAPEQRGNYILSASLSATLPTGSYRNGTTAAVLSPSLVGGKGAGRWDALLQVGSSLPVKNTGSLGRTVTVNTAVQYHAFEYVWPEIETSTTAWLGSARDGNAQMFMAPGVILGRLPYVRHQIDPRRGATVGVAFQTALTPYHTYNHALAFTTRLHF